jgi:hypothetical protein
MPLLILFFIPCLRTFPQENLPPGPESIFVINSFVFNVDGQTRHFALINKGNFIKGEEIAGISGLEKYIQDKTQILYNERVLESVSIEHSIGQMREDGKYPVDLVVNVKDSWNIIAIPRPMYSSNSGLDISIKARDYNFLGTMTPLRLDLGYRYDEQGRNFFLFMLDTDIPFTAFGLNWNFIFVNNFEYRPDLELPFYYENTTGLSVQLPVGPTTVTAGFDESLTLNEEIYGGYFQEGIYLSSRPYISWRIPTGFEIDGLGEPIYTLGISATFNHGFPQWPLKTAREGPYMNFYHRLDIGRINWIGNFQKGVSVNIYNSFSYNFYNLRNDLEPLSSYYSISGRGYFIINDFFGISARMLYRHWINGRNGNAGDVLRGVIDRDINADYMLSFNLDFPVRVLRFKPSEWFGISKLRIFNFDLHLAPIVDAALYHEPASGTVHGFSNLKLTGGLEAVVFPDFIRSLFLRVSLGLTLPNLKNYEIYIGTDFHY